MKDNSPQLPFKWNFKKIKQSVLKAERDPEAALILEGTCPSSSLKFYMLRLLEEDDCRNLEEHEVT